MDIKRLQVTLNVEESRRLIAKGLLKTELFEEALEEGKIIIANGTTNAYLYEEILNETIEDKGKFTAGIVTEGVACITSSNGRMEPLVIIDGKKSDRNWLEVVSEFDNNDIFVKGANAFDVYGRAGIMIAGPGGGTIGKAYGHLVGAGSLLVIPVGIEKLIPSLEYVVDITGTKNIDYSIGKKSGMFVVPDALIFTEEDSFETLFDVTARAIAAGGIKESKGSVTFIIEGEDSEVLRCLSFVKELKKEKPIAGNKALCDDCGDKCQR
jgi:hypothetical protein